MSHSHDRAENPHDALRTSRDSASALRGGAPTGVRYQVMAFLGALAFLTYFDRICISKAEGAISGSLGLTDVAMGWIMGAFWFAYAVFELPAGRMGDRHGARITLTRIVLAWSLFTALSGMAAGFWSLILCRFLFGVGEAGAYPNMARIQSRWLPASARPVFGGALWMFSRWGGAFSIPLFGAMMGWFEPLARATGYEAWRWSFWAAGLIGLIWVAAFYPWFRDHPSEKKTVNPDELELLTRDTPPEVKGHAMEPGMWRRLLTCRSLLAFGILYMCGSFGWSFFASWMPKYFQEKQQQSVAQAELDVKKNSPTPSSNEPQASGNSATSSPVAVASKSSASSDWRAASPHFFGGVACFAGGVISIWLVRRVGSKRLGRAILPMFGYVTAAVAMFCVQFVDSPDQAMILLCIAEAAHDLGQGANWASIVDIGGKYAGVAAGLINTIGNMGNAFQPVIGAAIRQQFGWNVMFTIYSVAFLLAASMWLFIDPTRTFYDGGDRAAT